MSSTEKFNGENDASSDGKEGPISEHSQQQQQPTTAFGKLKGFYGNPMSQIALIGFCCFLCPGMFNALSGIGGGGQLNPRVSSKSNTALNAVFAGASSFIGTFHNKLGTRLTLFLGACGYPLYIASFLCYNHTQNEGFVIAAGAILGFCASLFWSAQGAVMLSYPLEQDKSKAFALVWVIFNLGAVIGSAIELGLTYNSTASTLSDGVYVAFLILTLLGACCASLLKAPSSMIRSDGTRVYVPPHTTWKKEFVGLYRLVRTDYWVIFLFPLFFSSNFFYTWQQQDYNAPLFTLRARSLNSMLYWMAQMVAAYLFSFVLDSKTLSRPKRIWIGWGVVFTVMWAVWGGSYAKQIQYTRADVVASLGSVPDPIDILPSRRYAGPALLYAFSGFFDAVWQSFAYALMGAFSNDMSKLAFLAGFYKSIQSAGGATGFAMDSASVPYMTIMAVTWALCAAGLVIALPVLMFRVTESTNPLTEITAPGREEEVKKAAEEAIERTGVVPAQLRQMEKEEGISLGV
ncbi:MFS general substrate transporter [Meira miltonrushii]|uniref:MFS general substrate transporter n=1 Tax=Meira miltonrushii TaxID=1280837 RepID=A0A316VMV8_9BASI|nr:MFS general substrate transporter [Meira miltonrushii]PWN37733.1 MFS general substrate transporter [Meira miltonrushii]